MRKRIAINDVYLPNMQEKRRYNVLYGGAGSGKSYFAAQKHLLRLMSERQKRMLVIRKVKATVNASVYQLLSDVINEWGIASQFKANKNEFRYTHLPTGNSIFCTGLDDPEKIKSIQGITDIWIEEATELTEHDFEQLDLRIRNGGGSYSQITVTFNPIDERHWLKKRFFDAPDSETATLKTTYKDNYFLSEAYRQMMLRKIHGDENLYRIYVLGEWGKERNGAEFYKKFSRKKHVAQLAYNPDLPLHLSFDFNVMPYVTCVVAQIEGKEIRIIDEILARHPHNSTGALCAMVMQRYGQHKAGVFVYGDPAGKAADTRQTGSDYTIIFKALHALAPADRVQKAAPPVALRGQFINQILDGELYGIRLIVGENCSETIADFEYLMEAPDGSKYKQKAKGTNGVSFELYGHTSDAIDYLICSAFAREFDTFRHGERGKPLIIPRPANLKRL